MRLLQGKRALATGIATRRFIAYDIAHRLHQHGAILALTHQGKRGRTEVEKLAAELGSGPVFECDRSSDASLAALCVAVNAQFGKLDTFIHSTPFVEKGNLAGKVFDTSRASLNQALGMSTYSLIALLRAVRESLNDGASILPLTYPGSNRIVPNYNIAGIAKAAIESIMRFLAYDLERRGIRINTISADPIETPSSRQVGGPSKLLDVLRKVAPLRRNATPEDGGNCAAFFASDLASTITARMHFVAAGYRAMEMYPLEFCT